MTTWWICATCGVEHAERPDVCAICADERQWVPADGQRWTTLDELREQGVTGHITELEPDLFAITATPSVGIGQQSKLIRTPSGNLLWDPLGYVDEDLAARVRELGDVVVIAASHPHMFGVQVEWSRLLGGVPILVADADEQWVARPHPLIVRWSGERKVLPGVTLSQPGGHFPGSSVAHWAAGANGQGVLLAGDTIFANPDRASVGFMRSYPNHIPLSGAVAERVAAHVERYNFDRLYNNFQGIIPADARGVLRRSADRHVAWARGDFDHLT